MCVKIDISMDEEKLLLGNGITNYFTFVPYDYQSAILVKYSNYNIFLFVSVSYDSEYNSQV